MCSSVSLCRMPMMLPLPCRFMPDLTEASTILSDLHIQSLAASVPARFRQSHWTLVRRPELPQAVCRRLRPSGERCQSPHRPLAQLFRCAVHRAWLPCPGSMCRERLHTARSSWLLHAIACLCSRRSRLMLPLQMYSTTRHGISLQTLYRRAAGERCVSATCLQPIAAPGCLPILLTASQKIC